MKYIKRCLVGNLVAMCASGAHAGLFGVSNYQECIDDVVKNAKVQAAVRLGEENCFDKYIQPEFDRRYQVAARNSYRKGTVEEISMLKCVQVSDNQLRYLECSIPNRTTKIYSIKISANFLDGSNKDIELKNSVRRDPVTNEYSWGDSLYFDNSPPNSKLIDLKRQTLWVRPNN